MINKYINALTLVFCGLFFMPLAQAEWVDISPSVEITQSRAAFDRVNRILFSYVKVKNQNEIQKVGRIKLIVSNASVPVLNATKNIYEPKQRLDADIIVSFCRFH